MTTDDDLTRSPAGTAAVRPVALLCLAACLALVLYGWVVLGFSVEPTSSADADTQRGQELAFPAVIGAVAAAVALLAAPRRWAKHQVIRERVESWRAQFRGKPCVWS